MSFSESKFAKEVFFARSLVISDFVCTFVSDS